MKQANPFLKFFTFDLYPDEGEIGNSFWGYHIANNFSRLMGVEGTLFFPEHKSSVYFTDPEVQYVDISVANLQLTTAPIIQFSVFKPLIWQSATAYATSVTTGLHLSHGVGKHDTTFVAHGDFLGWQLSPGINPFITEFEMKLGTNGSEIIKAIQAGYTYNDTNHYLFSFNIAARNLYSTPSNDNMAEEEVRVVTSATRDTSTATVDFNYINPPYVEGYLDGNVLRVRYMHDDAGTVVYKIFGA